MKKSLIHHAFALIAIFVALYSVAASAQTLSLNDGSVTQSKTKHLGINIGAIDFYDNGQILKNLVGSLNPSFEPLTNKQIWTLTTGGTATSFASQQIYDSVPANYWTGASFQIVSSQTNNGQAGCSGTITGNTGSLPIKSITRAAGIVTLVTSSASGFSIGNQLVVENVGDNSFNGYPAGIITSVIGNTIVYMQAGSNATSSGGTADQIAAPVYTTTACGGPFSIGDMIIISETFSPTPESWWENSIGGFWGNTSNGGKLTSDTTDLCPTCGTQSITFDASATGSSAGGTWYWDSADNGPSADIFVLMNGTYQISFWAKAASGSPTLTISANRPTAGGFSCGNYVQVPTSTWTQYTFSCTASESQASTTPGGANLRIIASGGAVYFDNISLQKTGSTQASVFRDEVMAKLTTFAPGVFRYWVSQNAESADNWTRPDYQRAPTAAGTEYYTEPNGAGVVTLSLEDFLVANQILNSEPYIEIPVTFTPTDAANLIEFLASTNTSSGYGQRRAALGQTAPWTTVFSKIHLSFCNECWNTVALGQNIPYRANAPFDPNCYWGCANDYYDYSTRARVIFAAMRSAPDYSSSPFDLVMNIQTPGYFLANDDIKLAQPDSVELEGYTYFSVNDTSSDEALWQPAFVEAYNKILPTDNTGFYTSLNQYQSANICGVTGTTACNVNIYEWADSTTSGSIDQKHLDYITAGAGQGVVAALEPLLNIQKFGLQDQNYFALTELYNGGPNGEQAKLWGSTIDMGGATNNVRPQFLAMTLVNQSIIGPMYSCPIAGNPTFNFAGSSENGTDTVPAVANVPYLYSFCFENGTKRSIVLINTDISNSHTVNFAGTNPPSGTVMERQLAPSSLDDMNEAPTGSPTNLTQASVSIETSTLSSPGSVTIPPSSVTAYDWTSTGLTPAATPTFSVTPGTYPVTQTVAINDATGGATIYYTTNGTTPTTSSSVYGGPITVSATETLEAIAVGTGYYNSPVAVSSYTINPNVPAPTFSPAGGVFTASQLVTISDTTSGTTIYYTTNGTTPSSSSTLYTGPITVSASETLEAIAIANGDSNTVGTATFTITTGLATPIFSVAAGSYSAPQLVTITDASNASTVYYTTNGTTPTAASTKYAGAITVNASETLKAVAIETGFANSALASAAYTINTTTLPAPKFSPAAGTYTAPQTVTISDSMAGTTIYYTTDGTTPTTSSAQYAGAFTVSAPETLKAIAAETGYSNSSIGSAVLTIIPTVSVPTFTPATGTYFTTQSVTVSDSTTGATIYYTTNGTTPTTSSTIYTGPIPVSASETLKAIAVETGYGNSAAGSAVLTINPIIPLPTFTPATGTYTTTQSVTIAEATPGTTICYTTNGTTPTTSSTKYTGAITVSSTETLQAIAIESGYTTSAIGSAVVTINPVLPTPIFSPVAGTYTTTQSVTILDAVAGTAIYYTTDGSTPTTSSARYAGAITVSSTETLKAIAVEANYTNSAVGTAVIAINPTLPAPNFSPAAGRFASQQSAAITDAMAGTTIYYTTDGTAPTISSTMYTGPFMVSTTETLKAIAVETGYTNSAVGSAVLTITTTNLPAPGFSPAAGTYSTSQPVTISDSIAGTTIYYTTNGVTPTTSSTQYTGAITVSSSETLQAIAVKTGNANSAAAAATYTIAPLLPAPTFSLLAGTYTTAQSLTISDSVAGATVYYTTNGVAPTTSSARYTGPIAVSSTEILEAIAVQTGYSNSPLTTAAYTISAASPGNSTYINYPNTGFTAATIAMDGGASVTGGLLQITDGGSGESRTAWFTNKVPVQSFVTDFTFQQHNGVADGMTFTIQGQGLKARGYVGGGLGYQYIPTSVAIKFDLHNNAGEGNDSTGIYTNGASPTVPAIDLNSTGINFHNSHVIDAHMVYDGTNLSLTLTDTVTSAAVTEVFPVNIPSIVGGNTAYVGFTGGTGNNGATQEVLSWTYLAPAQQSAATPSFSVKAGNYNTAQTVKITDSSKGATIYYTSNGATPTTSSAKYSGPITVSANESLKAIAVESGYATSAVAAEAFDITKPETTFLAYANSKFTATNLSLNKGASVKSGLLQLTDGGAGESRSAWFKTEVPVQNFVADFTFEQLNAAADGMTFTIQKQSPEALGSGGLGLGYQGISDSVAIKFDLVDTANATGDSVGLYTKGIAPTLPEVALNSTAIKLNSGHVMHAHLLYDGANIIMTLTDTVTNAAVTEAFAVNIPGIVGSETAYVGFTGATGSLTATQNVLSWSFLSSAQ